MKKLILKDLVEAKDHIIEDDKEYCTGGCEKIILICKKRGYEIDLLTAYNAWFNYSAVRGGQWLWQSPIEEATFQGVMEFCTVVKE